MKEKLYKILLISLSSLMGLLFLYSGYTKLYPIEPFEYTFVDLGIGGWRLAPFIARILISLEFFIGIMLFFNLSLKSFTLKLTSAVLFIFTIYLVLILIKEGNNGNCGCFGEAIAMTPLQAILKNLIMLGVCFFLFKYHEGYSFGKLSFWISLSFLFSALLLPHVLNYVDLDYSQAYLNKPEDKFELTLDTLYNNSQINPPPKTLSQGKHILAFMSATCPHCRVAAKKMRIMKEKNNSIDIYFVLNGDQDKLDQFHFDTKTKDIPYCKLGARPFIYLAGTNLPTIYLINNSVVEHWVNYLELDQSQVEKWLQE